MNESMNRRDCLRMLGFSGLTAGLGTVSSEQLFARDIDKPSGFESSVIATGKVQNNRDAATLVNGKVIQPRRELSILDKTDVLVVGGGPAGVVAASAPRPCRGQQGQH